MDNVNAPPCNHESGCASDHGQQNTFRKQLADQALPPRAQSGADSNFFGPPGSACEQQVGHIGARNQQYHGHRSQQYQQHTANITDYLLLQTYHVHPEGEAALVLLTDAGGNGVDIVLCPLHVHARLQAYHDVVVFIAALLCRVSTKRQGQDDIDIVHRPL